MAERNIYYAAPTATDAIDYQPLSLLAVAGLGVAAVYALLVLGGAATALFKGEPFILSDVLRIGFMALALLGAALSGLGIWHVRTSEGTRAGAALAKWGLGISLVLGLGYYTYETFTGLAILQQANRFLLEKGEQSGFFSRLYGGPPPGSDSDARTAFLYTLDVADRVFRPDSAKDMESLDLPVGPNPKGRLTQFMESPLVCMLRSAPATVKIEPLAVRSWTYENGAYHITRGYRLSTEEAVYELPMTVSSVEPVASGEKRRWKVQWQFTPQLQPFSRSELGRQRQELRQLAQDFLVDHKSGWFTHLNRRQSLDVYLMTRPPEDRKDLREQYIALKGAAPLGGLAGTAIQSLSGRSDEEWAAVFLPGYRQFDKLAEYFKTDNLRVLEPDAKFLPAVKEALKHALTPDQLLEHSLILLPMDHVPIEQRNGKWFITCKAELVRLDRQKGLGVLAQLELVLSAPESLDLKATNVFQQFRVESAEFLRAWKLARQ